MRILRHRLHSVAESGAAAAEETTPGTATMLPKTEVGSKKKANGAAAANGSGPFAVKVSLLRFEEGFNPREDMGDIDELARGLRESKDRGRYIPPIEVRKKDGEYYVVNGHRRVTAAKKAGIKELDAVRVKTATGGDKLILALLGNQGKPLMPVEEALAFKKLVEEHKVKAKDIARATGKSLVTVKQRLKLAEGDPDVLDAVAKGQVAAAMGSAIVKKSKGNKKKQKKLVAKAKKSKAGKRAVATEVGHNKKWNAQQAAAEKYSKLFGKQVKPYNSKQKASGDKVPSVLANFVKQARKRKGLAYLGFLAGVAYGAAGKA